MKQTLKYISNSNKEFVQEINDGRGWNHFGRALTAKILFFSFLYLIQSVLLPKIGNYKIVSIIAGFAVFVLIWELWNHIFKEHCPKWVDDVMSGRIFFKLDIKELNLYIVCLASANLFIIFLPKIITMVKLNLYEKK